jgi:hypothetical protein
MTAKKKPLTFNLDAAPPVATPAIVEAPAPVEERKQVGARVLAVTYRQLKSRAALQGLKVQDLVEQAISEFLANHPAP